MIYTVTLNPSVDRTLTVDGFSVGGTFKATHSDCLSAGKGINVARVVATLGKPVTALGLVGQDAMPAFAATLAECSIENRLVAVPGATRISVTILDPVGHTETHLREPGLQPPVEALDCVRRILGQVTERDWVVFAGSLPPGLPVDTYRRLIRLVADRGAQTLLDANGPPLLSGVLAPPTLLKVNLYELWQVVGRQAAGAAERAWNVSSGEILDAARDLQARGVRMVVVSLGRRGVIGLDAQGCAWSAFTQVDRPVVDTVGSGDALGAGCVVALSQALFQGAFFAEVLRLGVACGAANTLVAGAGRCNLSDIDRLAARASVAPISDLSGLPST